MCYQAFILLPANCEVSLNDIEDYVWRFYSRLNIPEERWRVRMENSAVLLTVDSWNLYLGINREAWVIEEAAEIAEALQQGKMHAASPECLERAHNAPLATYSVRIEISSDEDPNMDYFNEYIFAIESLEHLPGSVPLDPQAQMFM
jgi:hypothetical protein